MHTNLISRPYTVTYSARGGGAHASQGEHTSPQYVLTGKEKTMEYQFPTTEWGGVRVPEARHCGSTALPHLIANIDYWFPKAEAVSAEDAADPPEEGTLESIGLQLEDNCMHTGMFKHHRARRRVCLV